MATVVFVHGGWDGAWAWRGVARILLAAGHEVFTSTLTGAGERVHLASPDIDLDTYILDVVNLMRYENLREVTLIGHSSGGMVITGVAECVPERLKQVIYLDAFVPQDGESLWELVDPMIAAAMDEQARAVGEGWRVPHSPPDAYRRTDVLVKPFKQHLAVKNPNAAQLKHTYVLFTGKPAGDWLEPLMQTMAARARRAGWSYRELPTGHFPILDNPEVVASLLLELV